MWPLLNLGKERQGFCRIYNKFAFKMLLHKMNSMILRLYLLALTFTFLACISAQPKKKAPDSPADKYADEAWLERGRPGGSLQKALELCNKGVRKDSNYAKIWEYKAAIEFDMKDFKACLKSCDKLLELEPDNYAIYFTIGKSHRYLMQFDEAKIALNKYLTAPIRRTKSYEDEAKEILKNIDVTKALYNNPVEFKPQNLGPNVNTPNGEYWPGLTLDGKYFYFTRMMFGKTGPFEDFYRSDVVDSTFGPSLKLPPPINTVNDEGTISITADGKTVFFSTNSPQNSKGLPQGLGRFDIYFSAYNMGQWSEPANLGAPVNSEHWDAQPSISPDGFTLYFSSNRPGGFGGSDIYSSTFNIKERRFMPPVNLGAAVNTAGEEQSPFIHYDNQTLYFSSTGLQGIGGLDIFVAKRGEDGKFTNTINIGYPINTEQDELGLIVDRLGKFGYLSSERSGGYGGLDIYKFELPEKLKPEPVSYVDGTVFDAVTNEKLVAKIELTNLTTGKVIANIESQKGTGNFFMVLKSNQDYMLTIDQTNYLFYSANFALKEHSNLEPYHIDVPLRKPVAGGDDVTLNNVFFDVDKFELKPESKYELDKLVMLMKKFPFMKIEIGGHTDNTGDKAKNKTLSQNRAKAVKDYLVNAGIDNTRLNAVGYGDSKPISDNKTAEGRAMNRRTVFKVISVQ
jgi:outer membrane protein OmpA-like peptidoglycan-associated protein/tetratricopeptide (TPR) repeat protein